MDNIVQEIVEGIETVAESLNLKPSTVGRKVLGSGVAYKNLKSGKRQITTIRAQQARSHLAMMGQVRQVGQ